MKSCVTAQNYICSLIAFSTETEKRFLTCAATYVLCHNAAEVPEAWFAAVALLSPNARLTRALTGGWVARPLVGAVDVTLAGT